MLVRAKGLTATARTEELRPVREAARSEPAPLAMPDLPRTWVNGEARQKDGPWSLARIAGTAAPAVVGVLAGVASLVAPQPASANAGLQNVGTEPVEPQSLGAPRADAPTPAPKAAKADAPKMSAEERELFDKVTRLVNRNFGGDHRRAFDHYAGADRRLDADELGRLLSDAGVGNMFTRGAWVSGVMERLDANGDHAISWSELQSLLQR